MTNFLVAESLRQADNTASIDWGWERTGNDTWKDCKGETVRYTGSFENIRGHRDVTIYYGYGWWRNNALRHIEDYAEAHGWKKGVATLA